MKNNTVTVPVNIFSERWSEFLLGIVTTHNPVKQIIRLENQAK